LTDSHSDKRFGPLFIELLRDKGYELTRSTPSLPEYPTWISSAPTAQHIQKPLDALLTRSCTSTNPIEISGLLTGIGTGMIP
jgi:hypothetical protein